MASGFHGQYTPLQYSIKKIVIIESKILLHSFDN